MIQDRQIGVRRRWQRIGPGIVCGTIRGTVCRTLLGLLACALAPLAGAQASRPWSIPGDSVFLRETSVDANGAIALAQDSQGYIWIGNQTGLLRWDGYRARTYAPDLDSPGALPDNYVSALLVDWRGRLWIGTEAGGLARYEPLTDSFITVHAGTGGLRDASVSALAEDGAGGLYVATRVGLDHMDAAGVFTPLEATLPAGRIQALLRDHEGSLWVGTSSGLARRTAGGTEFQAQPLRTPDGGAPGVLTLYEDSEGRIWVGTNAHGAFFRDPGHKALRAVEEGDGHGAPLADSIKNIVQARDGEVWLGTANSGVVRVDTRTMHVRRERHDDSRPSSLSSDEIEALFRDRDGWVWVGTSAELCGYDPRPRAIETYFGGSNPSRLVAHASVMTVLTLPSGRVWIGLGEGGVEVIDPVLGRVAQIRPDPAHPNTALPRSRVASMALAPDGSLYLGTQAGLYHASVDGAQIERVEIPHRSPTSEIRGIRIYGDEMWIGGRDGLWMLHLQPGQPPALQRHLESELGDPRVSVIERGADNGLWIGTFGGLERLDLRTGELQQIPIDTDDKNRQRGWDVSAILTDRQGRLWVGTFGRGIQVEVGQDANGRRKFQRIGTHDGLPHNGVDMLLMDHQGDIWASTDGGLARIDPQNLRVRVFHQAQGVGISTFWTASGAVTPAGELLFGGIGGLLVVHPERIQDHVAAPALAVTEIHLGDRMIPPAQLKHEPMLQVAADNRSLMVEFAALSFSDPEHQQYSYRLEGFDSESLASPASRRLASYTNLPPGNYTLKVNSSLPDGSAGNAIEIPVQVLAAWYQRESVQAGALLVAIVCVGGLVHLRTLYLRRRQRELQRLVAERTTELEQRTHELQVSHEELRRSQEKLEKMAYFDPLTGLPNRRMFNDDLRHLIARSLRGQGDFALVLVDLDGFKQVNDERGHHAGDSLLLVVAERLKALVRDSDRVARLGGDEFAVLLANSFTVERVEAMCARMVANLREPMLINGQTVQITASLGIAPCPREGETPDDLYKAADTALYEAKRSGRDTWRWSVSKVYTFTLS